jgi:ubiquinone/menaquinone biosynthesis C-methylase UbiE
MKSRLIQAIAHRVFHRPRRLIPAEAYNAWAETYDTQLNNPVLMLESEIFTELLARISVKGKTVMDVGCGTGRHWKEILAQTPNKLTGADPSAGMLLKLKSRFPSAEVFCSPGERLTEIDANSYDAVISTLALAHIEDAHRAIREWCRIVREGGTILITDFHPDAVRAGMKRTCVFRGRTLEIEHHLTEIQELKNIAASTGLTVAWVAERSISDSVRGLFEREHALARFETYKGLRLVFGLLFVKS